MWEQLCTDFLRYFQILELKGALSHSLLSSAAGWGSAQGFGFPGQQLVPVALSCWQESVESLRGVKEMSSLQESSFRIGDGLYRLKMTLERNWCRCLG